MVQPSSVIGGRYRLDHLLGEGGMGVVWAATHTLTGKRVAIKLLKADVASPELLRRFVREASAASAVRHPNVVEIHDIVSLDDGSPALVMDLLEGETLAQRLARRGPMPLIELAAMMTPVVSAVGTVHAAGLIHRDLKPDNIFLAELGDGRIEPMVLDFGIAKVLPLSKGMSDSNDLSSSGAMLGTPFYMAPEQALGERDLDVRADVWSLGVILYECSSGRKPVSGETLGQVIKLLTTGEIPSLEQLVPGLPREFVALVTGMLQRDRQRRTSDLREPFRLLREWSGSSARGSDAANAILPAPRSLTFDKTRAKFDVLQAAPVVQKSAGGLGASAVPVTKRVHRTRRATGSSIWMAAGAAGVIGLVVSAALLRSPAAPNDSAAPGLTPKASGNVGLGPLPQPSTTSAASASASASARPLPYATASNLGRPAKANALAHEKRASATVVSAPSSEPPPKRRLLPGGIDEAIPF